MKKVVYLLSAVVVTLGMAMPKVVTANSIPNDSSVTKEVKYQEIPTENVPKAITESLANDYSGYQVDKAYLGDDGSYKLEVSQADVKHVVFYKENGELIKVEEPASEEPEQGTLNETEKLE